MLKKKDGYPVYPLTAAQKFHFFYQDFCPKKEVLNIGTSLTIGTELDWDVLKQSIFKAIARNDFMRIRFTQDKDGNWYQYVIDQDERKDIEFVDFTRQSMVEAYEVMRQWTQVPFERESSCMNRIVMIKTIDGYKKMRDICEGDLVQTHTGEYHKVLTKLCYNYHYEKININGIECTPEHKLYVVNKKDIDNITENNYTEFAYWVEACNLDEETQMLIEIK